ncbi:right-handed parallel beta-helix repeat-containing protein [candidate division KSB1 bacterium]|nr:right-handed parallel beta-helix repeat-containing protein [candidate division KSB1 bacterium]
MKILRILLLSIGLLKLVFAGNQVGFENIIISSNINTLGYEIQIQGDDNCNASVVVKYRPMSAQTYKIGHAPARTDANTFFGSLFELEEEHPYEAIFSLSDPDGMSGDSSRVIQFRTTPKPVQKSMSGVDYYVAIDGNDANPGTSEKPFKTIQKAANKVRAGDIVHVQPGTYFQSTTIERGGQSGNYVTFRVEGKVILDGSDQRFAVKDNIDNWQLHQSPGIYRTPLEYEPGQVYADGQQLYRSDQVNQLNSPKVSSPGSWVYANRTLYIRLSDGSDPDKQYLQVTRLEHALFLHNVNYVILEGFDVQYYGRSVYGKGIYLKNVSKSIIRKNKIHQTYIGLWLKENTSNGNLIEQNEFWETSLYQWPWEAVKGSYHEGAAISLEAGEGNIIRKNQIHGYFNGITIAFWDNYQDASYNRNVDIYNNLLYDIGDDCIEPEGTCTNLRIWNNIMYNCTVGISLAPITKGPVYAWRNVISNFMLTSFKFSHATTGICYIYHNTAYTRNPRTSGLVSSGPWKNITFRNNIISGTFYALEDEYLNGDASFDYDNLYTTDKQRFVQWKNRSYTTLTQFSQSSQQELHAMSKISQFLDVSGKDFRLKSNSPEIDKGCLIPNINDNFSGKAPDIGAYEFGLEYLDSIRIEPESQPRSFELKQNYPNPFKKETTISYALREPANVKLTIYNMLGQQVGIIEEGFRTAKDYKIKWQPGNLPSGYYVFLLEVGSQHISERCLLLK